MCRTAAPPARAAVLGRLRASGPAVRRSPIRCRRHSDVLAATHSCEVLIAQEDRRCAQIRGLPGAGGAQIATLKGRELESPKPGGVRSQWQAWRLCRAKAL